MRTLLYLIGSVVPMLLLLGRALAFRRMRGAAKFALDFLLLLVAALVGGWLIATALGLPVAGYHNPGVGVAYVPLLLVWLICLAWWLIGIAIALSRTHSTVP
jgi:hypothetical protein